jgi:hypothetical protein
MATETRSSNGFLYFIVGALVLGMAVLAFMFFNGGADTNNGPIEGVAESVGEAADEVGDAARSPG